MKNNNIRDLLSVIRDKTDQEAILSYLNNRMQEKEKAAFESRLQSDPFLKDALEGLSGINAKKLPGIMKDINARIPARARNRRMKRQLSGINLWIIITALIVLLIIIMSYLVLSRLG